jgi:cyclohexanone monooxygenase
LTINLEANELACQFIREKIKETVKDPEKARKLTPSGPHGRRPISENGYYEAFNKDHVDVVSLKETPIERITPTGIKTSDKEYELDVIVIATG